MFLNFLKNQPQSNKTSLKVNDKAELPVWKFWGEKGDTTNFERQIQFKHPVDFKKYEGIQDGIKVFEGVSLSEIFFLGRSLNNIPLVRGCRNLCSHCFLKAEIPIKHTGNSINTESWEDYISLMSGIKEMRDRVKQVFNKDFISKDKYGDNEHLALFLDSEIVGAKVLDKQGGIHDASEVAKIAYDSIGAPLLIDTTGWHKKDEYSKLSAQKLAKYFIETPQALYRNAISVSLNPFHCILEKSREIQEKMPEKALKLRDIYTSRIAEVIETFFECGVDFIPRVAPKGDHSVSFQRGLNLEIFDKIKKNEAKLKFSDNGIRNFRILKHYMTSIDYDIISPVGRAESFFTPEEVSALKQKTLNRLDDKMNFYQNFFDAFFDMPKTIDINGQVYVGGSLEKLDTGICLNFENKDKKTSVMHNYFEDVPKFYNPDV